MSAVPGPEAVTTYPPAGLDRRFYAFAIDRLIAWPLLALGAYAAYRLSWSDGGFWPGLLLLVGCVALVGVGFAVLLGLRGASPGKAALGLRVVEAGTGRPIGIHPALLRCLVLGVGGLPTFGLGVATLAQTAVLDPERRRRGWHDRVAESIVVDVRPAAEVEPVTDAAPRQVVNLTAMRLAPAATQVVAAPVTTPVRPPAPDQRSEQEPPPPREPPATQAVPSTTAPAPGPREAPSGQATHDPDRTAVRGAHRAHAAAARWRVTFDTGESLVVEGLVLVGRRPEGRPGEPVGHLVPLASHDLSLSKTHAQVQVAPDGALVVTDRGSTNGSALVRAGVARELSAGRSTTLLPGDTVRFGDRSMSVAREP